MASILILVIMAGCAAALFLKGTLVKSFVTFISALLASFAALWWYEPAAAFVIKQEYFVDYAQPVCFGALFLIAFVVLQAVGIAMTKQKIDFGETPERVGRAVFGLLLGYVISGVLLIGAAMAPLSSEYPYPRFEGNRADPTNPKGKSVLLNPDGFISGFFGMISGGSMNGSQSFGVIHAGFVDGLSLNRLPISQKMKVSTDQDALKMSSKSVWLAPDGLKDTEGKPVSPKSGYDLIVIRVGFTGTMLMDAALTSSQLQIQCKKKGDKPRMGGSAVSVYAIGYLESATQVKMVGMNEQIKLQNAKDGVVSMNFVCYVPKDYEPVVVVLRNSAIAEVPPMVTAEQVLKEPAAVETPAVPAPAETPAPAAPQDANAGK